MSYNIQWPYKPGPQNTVADALSRHPVKEGKVLLASTAAKLRKGKQLAEANPFLERVKQGYKQDPWFADPANTDNLTEASGVYTLADAIVVPDYDGLRLQVMQECHDAPYAGHPGRDKTSQLVKRWFWWPTVTTDVTQYVKTCDSCQRNKSRNKLPAGLLQPLPIPGQPWESFSMDMVVDLPQTEAGYDSITVFVDRQKMYADNSRRAVQYRLGQQVLLHTKNISLRMIGSPKFLPKYIGPFKITEKINEVAYRLDLPPTLKVHNVFHVSLLEEYRTREEGGKVHPPPLPELIDGALEYEVEQILLHQYHTKATKKNKTQKHRVTELRYLVKWAGYDVEHITWEPAENCQNCPEKVQEYWDSVDARLKAQQAQARLAGKRKR